MEVFLLIMLVIALAITVVDGYVVLLIWIRWTKVNLEGAGRKVYVGVNAWTGSGFVYPSPKTQLDRERGMIAEKNTFFVNPFMKTVAFVNPDRDELRIKIPIAPEGAPASTEDNDRASTVVRVSWAIPEWVVYHDVPDAPGDHGKLPQNLRVKGSEVPREVYEGSLKRHQNDEVVVDSFYPGWAAVAFMQKYTDGEHIRRIVEFLTEHAREFYGSYHVRELMRVAQEGEEGNLPLRYTNARIRGNTLPVPAELQQHFRRIRTRGEFQQAVGEILTWAARVELEPYGIFANDVTEVELSLPKRLVDASRAREARGEDVQSMRALTAQLADSVKELDKTGMTPDVSGLILADSVGTESRPGPLAALLTGLRIFNQQGKTKQ